MKSEIVLNIGGYEVDMAQSVVFSITKEFKNMGNPTNIINDWSKTITIPFTANNNKIFGHIYDPDRKILTSDNKNIGIYFDPSKKVDFKLFWNRSLIMDGYMKMTSIEKGKGYSVNLFGGLGKVFSELKKLTPVLTDTITDEKYLVDPLGIGGFYLTKENVGKSWNNLRNKFVENPLVNIVGFAPANSGYNDSFDSKTILLSNSDLFVSFGDILTPKYEGTIYDVDAIVGDGLLPRQIADYRSYYNQPYLFVDEMFNTLKEKCEELTEYTLNLDESWFNVGNPYYHDSVMLLKVPEHDTLTLQLSAGYCLIKNWYRSDLPRWGTNDKSKQYILEVLLDDIDGVVSNNRITVERDTTINVKYSLNLHLRVLAGLTNMHNLGKGAGLFVNVGFVDPTDDTKFVHSGDFVFVSQNNTWKSEYYKYLYKIPNSQWTITYPPSEVEPGHNDCTVNITGEAALKYNLFRHNAKMVVSMAWVIDDDYDFVDCGLPAGIYIYPSVESDSIINYEISSNDNRSLDYITFNDIWDNDYNYFDQCLKYTKMFNLVWDVDDILKTINVLPLSTYFDNEHNIEDWTDKVDFSSDYKLEPLLYDTKYYKLGYEESKIGLGETYSKKYGVTYGDKIIDTKYNFNDDTNNLIEGLIAPIINTTNVFSWSDMYAGNVVYRQCSEPMLCLSDNDNKAVNGFGAFMFYNGLKYFTDLKRTVCISDDTQEMLNTHTYTYIESSDILNAKVVDKYPYLDVVYNGLGYKLGYYFGKPKAKFDATTSYSTFNTIYDVCWKKYMAEYSSSNNHKLTAYVYLTPTDFLNFKFNKMVRIDHLVYVVNKISDYSFGNKTKCELIRVNNIDNYRTMNFPSEDTPVITVNYSHMTAADNASYLHCLLTTNISNFNYDNIRIVYASSSHGTLALSNIYEGSSAGTYTLYFTQSGFTGKSEGVVQIIYYSKRQMKTIVLTSLDWKIDINEEDDPVITTDKGYFNQNSLSINYTETSGIVTATTYVSILQDNVEIEKRGGTGTLSILSFTRVNNNPIITRIVLAQTGFGEAGGFGNLILKYDNEVIARIPWRVVGANESSSTVSIKNLEEPKILITDKSSNSFIDTLYVDTTNGKLLKINEADEIEETTSIETEDYVITNREDNKLVITYDTDKIDNVTINTADVKLYKNGYSYSLAQAPSRHPSSVNIEDLVEAEVEDIVVK